MEIRGLIAGLGNPGKRYDGTLHNCGFMFIARLLALAEREGMAEELPGRKFNARLWRIRLEQLNGIWLACEPQTFMNESGQAIQPLLSWYKLKPASLVVVQDEMDIPPGQLRFKFGGGLAGHNGLSSIARHLGTQDFYRLRIGIGHPARKEQILDWVLGRPGGEAASKLAEAIGNAIEVFFAFTRDGPGAAIQLARQSGRDG